MSEPIEIQTLTLSLPDHPRNRSLAAIQRSSRNALKHGIFSNVTVLAGESREKYKSLLAELHEGLQPDGRLECLLVEKLASISWRYRRFLTAEGAEIRQGHEFLDWDRQNRERQQPPTDGSHPFSYSGPAPALIRQIQTPALLDRCIELLSGLQQEIKARGFDEKRDTEVLRNIFGPETSFEKTLLKSYRAWAYTATVPEEKRAREKWATPEQCREQVISEIGKEIRRLREYRDDRNSIESERAKLQALGNRIPAPEQLDRLLRYEASLERAFDRTLNQLERMQRLRQGQPATPRLDLTISGGA
jgi:hypothetical protein